MRPVRILLSVVAAIAALYAVVRTRRPAPDRRVVASAESRADSLPSCGSKTISNDGVGDIRIGESIDSLRRRCRVVHDTTMRGLEGMMERRAVVAFPPGTVVAEIADGKVWRIEVTSPAFRTADSLGVGSPLAELLRRRAPLPMAGEGIVVVMVRDFCGVSFVLSGGYNSGVFRRWTKDELLKLPASTHVEKILVFGCAKKTQAG